MVFFVTDTFQFFDGLCCSFFDAVDNFLKDNKDNSKPIECV